MNNIVFRLLAERMLHRAVAQGPRNNPLDVKLGFALLRDRRVPTRAKLLSLVIGVGLLALLMVFEVPLEALVTFLAPILLPVDFAIDGIELVALPLLFATLLVAQLAPRAVVAQIRDERHAAGSGPVIDIQASAPAQAGPAAQASAPRFDTQAAHGNGPTLRAGNAAAHAYSRPFEARGAAVYNTDGVSDTGTHKYDPRSYNGPTIDIRSAEPAARTTAAG